MPMQINLVEKHEPIRLPITSIQHSILQHNIPIIPIIITAYKHLLILLLLLFNHRLLMNFMCDES